MSDNTSSVADAIEVTDGQGPVVVLLSAMGTAMGYWGGVRDLLSTGSTVIAYDRPGVGIAPPRRPPNPPLPFSGFAAELDELLAGLGIEEPVVLVGHSLGDLIALAFAARWPQRVAGMVHVDGSMLNMGPTKLDAMLVDTDDPAKEHGVGTEVDRLRCCYELTGAPIPTGTPCVTLTRAWGWWRPEFGPQAPQQDLRWHTYHAELARRWGGPWLVATDAGHYLPVEAPGLVAHAIDQVVRAVRDGADEATLDPDLVAAAGARLADPHAPISRDPNP